MGSEGGSIIILSTKWSTPCGAEVFQSRRTSEKVFFESNTYLNEGIWLYMLNKTFPENLDLSGRHQDKSVNIFYDF